MTFSLYRGLFSETRDTSMLFTPWLRSLKSPFGFTPTARRRSKRESLPLIFGKCQHAIDPFERVIVLSSSMPKYMIGELVIEGEMPFGT